MHHSLKIAIFCRYSAIISILIIFVAMRRLSILAISAAAALAFPAAAQDSKPQGQWAVTATSSNNLRVAPDYESALESQTLMGSILSCTGARERYWVELSATAPAYTNVWTTDLTLAFMDDKAIIDYIKADKYICTAEYSHVYESPSTMSEVICDLVMGDLLRKVYNDKGSIDRYIRFAKVQLPDGRTGYAKFSDILDFRDWTEKCVPEAKNIIATAKKFLGTPYLWGGNTVKGMDCSGLVWMSFYMNGVLLPRNADEMARCGESVTMDALQPGDLIFFSNSPEGPISHIGIYLGDHKIIHSSQLVRINSLAADDKDYYKKDIICARRITGHYDDGSGAVRLINSPWFFRQ